MKHRALSLGLVVAVALQVRPASADTSVMVETDPSTFVFGGFAAHVGVAPEKAHVVVGGGVYALDFPGFLVDLNPNDRGAGWNVRLQFGGALFGDYYFKPNADGWFVGAELALQGYRYTNDSVAGEARATNLAILPRGGYQWRPFDAGFYVMPWVGLGYQAQVGGTRQVGYRTYDLSPFLPYAAVHVGWRF